MNLDKLNDAICINGTGWVDNKPATYTNVLVNKGDSFANYSSRMLFETVNVNGSPTMIVNMSRETFRSADSVKVCRLSNDLTVQSGNSTFRSGYAVIFVCNGKAEMVSLHDDVVVSYQLMVENEVLKIEDIPFAKRM